MRLVTAILLALLVGIQYPLWWGHGGWLNGLAIEAQLLRQQEKNAAAKLRNDFLAAEVKDLQGGTAAIEERARYELSMIKDNELFVQFLAPSQKSTVPLPDAAIAKAL